MCSPQHEFDDGFGECVVVVAGGGVAGAGQLDEFRGGHLVEEVGHEDGGGGARAATFSACGGEGDATTLGGEARGAVVPLGEGDALEVCAGVLHHEDVAARLIGGCVDVGRE